jgi:hypothetical protein
MELNTEHRKALISELAKAKEDLFSEIKGKQYLSNEDLTHWYDIAIFLATERISLIEKSIIDNKIDY